LITDGPKNARNIPNYINIFITVLFATWYLSIEWLPLGAHNSEIVNFLFVAGIISVILAGINVDGSLLREYPSMGPNE
jgi:hypothetical protein